MWRERRKLVEMWRAGSAAAMATLVAVEGSSYRRPGARLMISSGGDFVGSISGGCLEAELARKARWMVRDGACVQRYTTAFDDTSDIPFGLGCGGTIHVLMEPANTKEFDTLLIALERSLQGEPSDVYTVLPGEGRALSRKVRSVMDAAPEKAVAAHTYYERLDPPQRLLVFGAGDDAQPVVRLAALLGWRTVVLDSRAQWARPERFPEAERVVVTAPEPRLIPPIQTNDFAVVMTHSFEQDAAWLRLLLPEKLSYVGLLGARHRSARLAGELASQLGWPLEEVCRHLHAPVGLDLGGDGAEAIALSIIAEMQACASHRPSRSRRMNTTAVSEQIALAEGSKDFAAQCLM